MKPQLAQDAQVEVKFMASSVGLLKQLDGHLANLLQENQQISKVYRGPLDEEFLCCCERARHAIKDFTNQEYDGEVSDCFAVAGDALCDLQWCLDIIFPGAEIRHRRHIRLSEFFEHGLGELLLEKEQSRSGSRRFAPWRRRPSVNIREYPAKMERLCTDLYPQRYFIDSIDSVLFPLVSELAQYRVKSLRGFRRYFKIERALVWARKTFINKLGPSVSYSSDASAHLPPGLNVDDLGEIQFERLLGEGSQGTVYRARWSSISGTSEVGLYKAWDQLVAVKEVSSNTLSEGLEAMESMDLVSRSNLYCELDVLKTLNHPNIVELKGYTRKARAGNYGLVMELMKCSLGDLIESETLSDDLVKVDTLLQVARGMHFLHNVAGIMHRDLKPANILIGELNYLPPNARRVRYMVAKLADFGLSKQVDGADRHTMKRGTHFYMAPELRKSCNNDSQSAWYAKSADVFSFGTTCFNVLSGEETPVCTGFREFYERIKRQDVDQWLQKCGSSQMKLLVRQCWCPNPNSRPPFIEICRILKEEKRRILKDVSMDGAEAGLLSTR